MSIRIGILGYGNLGRGVECAVKQNSDMELVAVFTRRNPDSVKVLTETAAVCNVADLEQWKDKILCVRGNCEAEVDQMVLPFPCMADYSEVLADGKRLFLTHGHHFGPDQLPNLPEGSLFLSGHTHVKMDEVRNGIRCLNPGSVSIPKDGSHSCMIYEEGEIRVEILEA